MKKNLVVLSGILILLICTHSRLSAEPLFSYHPFSRTLYAIDTDVPSATEIGQDTSAGVVSEIEMIANVIYASETPNTGDGIIHLINPVTGQVTGSLNLTCPAEGNVFTALEFVGSILYGGLTFVGGGGSSYLATINLNTGVVSTIGPTGLGAPLGGLAYNTNTSTMYAVTAGGSMANLATINLSTGAGTIVGPVNVGSFNFGATALEFGSSGALYALPNPQSPISGHLLLVNPATGAAIDLGDLGVLDMNALTAGQITPDIPTLSELGMIILSILLAGTTFYYIRKQKSGSASI